MDLNDFLTPVNRKLTDNFTHKSQLFNKIKFFTNDTDLKDLKKCSLAIIGINSSNPDDDKNSFTNLTRNYLYSFYLHSNIEIADYGNLRQCKTYSDILYGIRELAVFFISSNTIPIFLGDNLNLPFGCYLAYEEMKKTLNILTVDSSINLKQKNIDSDNIHYLTRIILRNKNYLFNYSLLGYQSYLISTEDLNTLSKLYFDAVRLGSLQNDIPCFEPCIRDSDSIALHTSSIAGVFNKELNITSPNGLTPKEFCQIARYSGISDRLTTFGIYGNNDSMYETVTAAQAIWYFIEGYSLRKKDYPARKPNYLTRFHVNMGSGTSIGFLKSPKSGRWWMEIPYPKSGFTKNLIVSCNMSDYNTACQGDVPDRWLKFYKKIS